METPRHPSQSEVESYLRSRGYSAPQRDPLSTPDFPAVFLTRRVDEMVDQVCFTNDHSYIHVTLYFGAERVRPSADVYIVGEYRLGRWTKLKLYSISWPELLADFPSYEEDVVRAWNALTAVRAPV